jgi:hypothetical protein
MVTLRFPVLAIETVCELLVLPTSTFPKLKLVTLGVSCSVCALPLPDNAFVVGEFVALLTTETLPVTAPAAAGEKASVSDALCPAAKVSGTAKPPAVNPAPVTATCEMLTLLLPVFVRTTDREPLAPKSKLLRFREFALAESKYVGAGGDGFGAEVKPVPDTATERTLPRKSRLMETLMLPEKLLAEVGRNTT